MSQEKRVVAISGTPRKHGNSDVLVEAALQGAREAGAATEKFFVRDMNISGCIECRSCEKTGVCILRDQMDEIYRAVESTDRLIIASPIFFYSVTSWVKACIDRFQPYWARKALLKRPLGEGRECFGGFIATGATHGTRLFLGSILTVKYALSDAGFRYAGHVLVRGVDNLGAIADHPEHILAARQFGEALVTEPEKSFLYEPI